MIAICLSGQRAAPTISGSPSGFVAGRLADDNSAVVIRQRMMLPSVRPACVRAERADRKGVRTTRPSRRGSRCRTAPFRSTTGTSQHRASLYEMRLFCPEQKAFSVGLIATSELCSTDFSCIRTGCLEQSGSVWRTGSYAQRCPQTRPQNLGINALMRPKTVISRVY